MSSRNICQVNFLFSIFISIYSYDFSLRRIPVSEIPQDTEECSNWVHKLYQEKDEIYDYFVKHGTFEGLSRPRIEIQRNYYDLLIELTWILIIGVPSVIYLLKFLLTSSYLAQIIFIILICIGKT